MSIKCEFSSSAFCFHEPTNSLLVHNLQYCCTTGKLISETQLPYIHSITSIGVPNQEHSILAATDGDRIKFYKASPDYKNSLSTVKSTNSNSICKNPSDQEDGTEKTDQEVRCSFSKCLKPETDVPGGLKKCTRCKSALYCSKECQVKHWKMHRLTCSNSHWFLITVMQIDKPQNQFTLLFVMLSGETHHIVKNLTFWVFSII